MSEANLRGEAASSSKGHNSAKQELRQREFTDGRGGNFKLTGTQAKTKHCIELNIAQMVRDVGIERVGFLTLTIGEDEGGGFAQVWDMDEANRRLNNLARRFLPSLFRRWIIVTERHKNGAIHFHLCVELEFDARTGYDWAAVREGDYSSACTRLKETWATLRAFLPQYGFGRSQLEPAKGAESLGAYVAKYVEKNLYNRPDSDKGRRLVRYGGWQEKHTRPCDICWATEGAILWRMQTEYIAWKAGGVVHRHEMAPRLGPRWAYRISQLHEESMFDVEHLKELWRRLEALKHKDKAKWDEAEAFERQLSEEEWERHLAWRAEAEAEMEMIVAWRSPEEFAVTISKEVAPWRS